MNLYKVLADQKRFLEKKGYNVLYVGLYGSQNYNMQDEESDVDVRAIVMPTLEEVISRKVVSKKYSNEYGDIDVKDLITYHNVVTKGNFSFMEPLQTKWYVGDSRIRDMFSGVKLNLKSVKGAMYEKAKAFQHRYPSKKEEFEKWGYDPKQLHHIFRLLDLLLVRDSRVSFLYYPKNSTTGRFLMNVKRNTDYFVDKIEYLGDKSFEALTEYIRTEVEAANLIPEDYEYEKENLMSEVTVYLIEFWRAELTITD